MEHISEEIRRLRAEWQGDSEFLGEFANALDAAPRVGTVRDNPEGSQYIYLSDTLARSIAQRLRAIAGKLEA